MDAFTPGPWVAEHDSKPPRRSFTIRAGRRVVAHYLAFDDYRRFEDERAEPANVQANARLIAAAPDLLAALRGCLNYIENTESELGISLDCGYAARSALAKT